MLIMHLPNRTVSKICFTFVRAIMYVIVNFTKKRMHIRETEVSSIGCLFGGSKFFTNILIGFVDQAVPEKHKEKSRLKENWDIETMISKQKIRRRDNFTLRGCAA